MDIPIKIAIVFDLVWIAICLGGIAGELQHLRKIMQTISDIYTLWRMEQDYDRLVEDSKSADEQRTNA